MTAPSGWALDRATQLLTSTGTSPAGRSELIEKVADLIDRVDASQESLHQPCMAKAWDVGYAAGQHDAYELEQAQQAGPSTAENLLAEGGTPNPYAVDTPTIPRTTTPTNPELWRD